MKQEKVYSDLRQDWVKVPSIIDQATGISIYGRTIRSVLFSTDVAIIANSNADAILAVYPFTPNPAILKSLRTVSFAPILAGIGGGLTTGIRSVNMGLFSEAEGAVAVVVNAPTDVETIVKINEVVDIPIIYTVARGDVDIKERLDAGVDILNVSCGIETATIVAQIRKQFPTVPIMATGGPTDESILSVMQAGANAITYTPPSNGELFKSKMEKYRENDNS